MIDSLAVLPGLLTIGGATVLGTAIASEWKVAREADRRRREGARTPPTSGGGSVEIIDLRDGADRIIDLRDSTSQPSIKQPAQQSAAEGLA